MIKEINNMQVVNKEDVYDKVFCSSCMSVVGYSQDENDSDIICKDCIND